MLSSFSYVFVFSRVSCVVYHVCIVFQCFLTFFVFHSIFCVFACFRFCLFAFCSCFPNLPQNHPTTTGALPERGPKLPERGPKLPEPGPKLPERCPNHLAFVQNRKKPQKTCKNGKTYQKTTKNQKNDKTIRKLRLCHEYCKLCGNVMKTFEKHRNYKNTLTI